MNSLHRIINYYIGSFVGGFFINAAFSNPRCRNLFDTGNANANGKPLLYHPKKTMTKPEKTTQEMDDRGDSKLNGR